MYLILFGFIILKFQITLSEPQFPPHIDLQKVGIAIFNNVKYNILKPTTHVVTDHFKDYMLRRGSTNTGERVFIDKNGFRHRWSGFLDEIQSLRKTDVKGVTGSLETSSENTLSDSISNDNTTSVDNSTNVSENVTQREENENNNQEEEVNNVLDNNETAQNSAEDATATPESKETTITLDELIHGAPATIEQRLRKGKNQQPTKPPPKKGPTTQKKDNKTIPKKPNPTTKPKDQNKTTPKKPNVTTKPKDQNKTTPKKPNVTTTKPKDQNKTTPKKAIPTTTKAEKLSTKVRTVATTTFFCPFLGVLTMSAFID